MCSFVSSFDFVLEKERESMSRGEGERGERGRESQAGSTLSTGLDLTTVSS